MLRTAALAAGRLASALKALVPPRSAETRPDWSRVDGISVVIPSRDGRELLDRLLPGLLAQLPPSSCAEVIVVDNGSSDDTAAHLGRVFPGVRIVASAEPLSFAAAVNRGVREARFTHICLLNNDMVLDTPFFPPLREAFRRVPDLFCATAQIFFGDGERRQETGKAVRPPAARRDLNDFPLRCDEPLPSESLSYVLYGSGGCSLVDAAKLEALGGVSEAYRPAYVEDLDLGYRAWQRGWPTVFVAEARCIHRHRATTTRFYSEDELALAVERNYLLFLVRAVRDAEVFDQLWREAVERLARQRGNDAARRALQAACRAPLWLTRQEPALAPEELILALGSGHVAVFPGRQHRGRPVIVVVLTAYGSALVADQVMGYDLVLVMVVDQLHTPAANLLNYCVEVVQVQREVPAPSLQRQELEPFDVLALRATLRQVCRKWKPQTVRLEAAKVPVLRADCAPFEVEPLEGE